MSLRRHGFGGGLGIAVALHALFVSGCQGPDWAEALDPKNPVAQGLRSEEIWEEVREALPFDSIRLARGDCDPECADYELVLTRAGRARYNARSPGPLGPESWVGSLDLFDYARLCHFIVESRVLNQLRGASSLRMQHGWGFELTVWRADAVAPETYRGWESDGPTSAWVLRAAMEQVVARAMWLETLEPRVP